MSDYTNSPLDGRPIMMMRLRYGNEVPGIWERLQKQLIRYKECADEVWFSTGVGIPPIGEHSRLAELIGKHAAELRKHGIIPSLQIQATIGRELISPEETGESMGEFTVKVAPEPPAPPPMLKPPKARL